MGKDSAIEWTHHTFNPWWGCMKVSPGCANCYAETLSKRFGQHIWGPPETTDRRLFGKKHWAEPLRWDKAAAAAGERHRVFCASMADVFEIHPKTSMERHSLFRLIQQTPNLDWLLLTKRPDYAVNRMPSWWSGDRLPQNVWIGTSVESQGYAEDRIPWLSGFCGTPGYRVRFLSCEPLLGPLDLTPYLRPSIYCHGCGSVQSIAADGCDNCWNKRFSKPRQAVNWVICGGESGPGARPMRIEWAESIAAQCKGAGVPFHMKQLGSSFGKNHHDIRSFPAALQAREYPRELVSA